jgi:hypothetical protein
MDSCRTWQSRDFYFPDEVWLFSFLFLMAVIAAAAVTAPTTPPVIAAFEEPHNKTWATVVTMAVTIVTSTTKVMALIVDFRLCVASIIFLFPLFELFRLSIAFRGALRP